ncbi:MULTISPECIES: restriction endonuclease subunit S [Clostridium]|uniref:restriction endonuclease subunit S n=1 Tax=Clostridium TaxID=1485 RepID=UPI00290B172E|nr:restriction endonuclease subunit S [Clostridium sp.]MDU6521377.1 restriction endonuclease subunit S [Clostridium sp.]
MKDGYKKTELGWIPNEWEINNVNKVTYLNPESLGNSTDDNLVINYIDIESVKVGKVLGCKEFEFSKAPSRARRVVMKNDVIVSTVRPNLKSVAKINFDKENLICSTGFAVLRKKETIDSEYLFQFVISDIFTKQLMDKTVGSNYPAVNSNDIKETLICIPPLKEQEKIADILSTVDSQIDYTDKLIEKTKVLKKGLMQRLLTKGIGHTEFKKTEVGEIPVEWEVKTISEIGKFIGGYAFKSSDYEKSGIPLVKIANVQQNRLCWGEKYYLPKEYINQYENYSLEKGDIVMAMTRPVISSGLKVCTIKESDLPCLLNQRVGKFDLSKEIEQDFLFHYMFTSYFIDKIRILCSTTGQPNISSAQVETILIPVPNIIEQSKISRILSRVDIQIEEYENKKIKLEELKKGLMQQLLTGKIRVN